MKNPLALPRLWWLPWAMLFVAAVAGTKRCAEAYVGDEAVVTEGFDPETWKPCPGRKPVREDGHKYVWYCGPEHPDFLRKNENDASAKASKADTAKREASGVGKRGKRRSQKRNG
jgi:hypothetical protein